MDMQLDTKILKGIVRRRKTAFLIPFLLTFLLVGVIAFMLPPVYRSETTIIVEGQQVPEDYVKTTITSYVDERLQVIQQQIMSRTRLMEIIERFNLYPELREKLAIEAVIGKMRDAIEITTISASVDGGSRSGVSSATIAFTLSYESNDASKAQLVSSELASLYLEENLRIREKLASTTTAFLEQEAEKLKEDIHKLENRIGSFKIAHLGELPEFNTVNLQAAARLGGELERLNDRIASLQEKRIYLKVQIAGVDPLKPVVTEQGKLSMNPKERLKGLRLQLITLQSSLSEKHPDIRKLQQEIKQLEAQVGGADDDVVKIRRLNELQGELARLKGRLGPKHPDVVNLEREVEMLSREVDNLLTEKAATEITEEKPDNPAYINLRTQIVVTDMDIQRLSEERERVRKKFEEVQKKIENAPLVEKQYYELTRDYDSAKQKHGEIVRKLMEARIAQGLEETQMGERFSITDPAHLPEKPYKPNRILIVLLGFVLGIGFGGGVAAAQEGLDRSVKTADDIASIAGVPVFSTISLAETENERRVRWIKKASVALAAVGAVVIGLVLVNQYVMPLEILWVKIQSKFVTEWLTL